MLDILSHLPFCTEHAHTLIFVILAVEKEVAEINCMFSMNLFHVCFSRRERTF